MKDLPLGGSTTCRRESLEPVYMNYEGVHKEEENRRELEYIKAVVWRALDDGLGIMIRGDMNAHIWELGGL